MERFHVVETLLGRSFDVRAPSLEVAFAAVRAHVQHDAMLLDVALPCPAGARVLDVFALPALAELPEHVVPSSVYWAEVAGDRRSARKGPLMPLLLLVTLVLGSACASLAQSVPAPERPNVSIVEDPRYEVWYHELEKCSGLKGDFHRLTIYETHDRLRLGRTFDGYWEPGSIVVRHRWEKLAVQHEMMHDLTGSARHPRQYFKGVCGDLMRGELPD